MADPQSKPPTTTTPTVKPPPPPTATKPNIHNRHPYRPNPTTYRRTHRRSFLCICCFWSILILLLLLLIATIAGCILYLLYRPHRPSFVIESLKFTQFNLSTTADDTTHLTSHLNLTLSTKNPNKKVTYYYDPLSFTCVTSDTVIANGSFPDSLASVPNNITIIRSQLYSTSLLLESPTVNQIRSDLKKKSGMRLKILLDTQARVKIESFQSKKVGIQIKCEGIHSLIPKNKIKNSTMMVPVSATVTDAKCNVDLRIKIWKWTFSS